MREQATCGYRPSDVADFFRRDGFGQAGMRLPRKPTASPRQNKENGFAFRLLRPDGTTTDSPSFTRNGISAIGTVILRPGDTITQELLLNDRFQFNIPGKYQVVGHLAQEITDEKGGKLGSDTGFEKDLEIVPKDESSLRKVCQDLSERLERSNSYEASALIARELATVDDPVAVPFLDKALRGDRMIEPFIISALVRIGDGDAAQALIRVLNAKTGAAAEAARRGLTQIQSRTTDPSLKELIDRVLRDCQSKGS